MDQRSPDAIAQALPDYELAGELGRGSFGVVWRARHRHLDRDVAIKQLLLDDDSVATRFRHEARLLAQLDHPHVVRVFDYRELGSLRLLVMELLPGGSLARRTTDGAGQETVLDAAVAAAWGLAHAHDRGILHRDVTPANLLFDHRDTVKVTDFGIAVGPTRTGHAAALGVAGTPAFVAPEQTAAAFGQTPSEPTAAADQYALAATLYHALSGELPHDPTGGALALWQRRRSAPARPITTYLPDLPAALAAAIMQALETEPGDRHRSMTDFAAALQAARSTRPSGTPGAPNPPNPVRLLGRDRDIEQVRAMLGDHAVVSVVAAAGVGKSSVARVIADMERPRFAAVGFVDLLGARAPGDVAREIARTLEIHDDGDVAAIDAVADRLGDRRALLVLDNCEHVLGDVSNAVSALRATCPSTSFLATSREPLHVVGEAVHRLLPLDVPPLDGTPEQVDVAPATRLFVERARVHQPDFAVNSTNRAAVSALVRTLDGIPLALELAAARLRSLTVVELTARLDHRFQLLASRDRVLDLRHRTLRHAIAWSFDLLDDDEQRAMQRWSVFVGGFDVGAAASLLGDDEAVEFQAIDLLDTLVDKSLLQRQTDLADRSRYRMLESIREYASDQLTLTGPGASADARRAHLRHFASIATADGALLSGPAQVDANLRLRIDHDNLRAAMATAVEFPEVGADGMRLVTHLRYYWARNGVVEPIIPVLEALVARAGDAATRAAAFTLVAESQCALGQVDAANLAADRAFEEAEATGDAALLARARRARALARLYRNDATAAMHDLDAVVAASAGLDPVMTAEARSLRAYALRNLGRDDDVAAEYEMVRCAYRECGDLLGLAGVLVNMADFAISGGHLDEARDSLREADVLARRLESPALQSLIHGNWGLVAIRSGDRAGARRHFAAGARVAAEVNDRQSLVNNLCGCAATCVDDDPRRAATLLGAAEAITTRHHLTADPNEDALRVEALRLLSALDDDGLRLAMAEGAALPTSDALGLARPDEPDIHSTLVN